MHDRSIAFVTMDDLEGYVTDDHLAVPELDRLGWAVESVSWRAPRVRWERFAGVVIRSPWDYQHAVGPFIAALESIDASGARLANPLLLVRWNIRKSYLVDLAARGCPLPDTVISGALDDDELASFVRDCGRVGAVVKPMVGGGGVGIFHVRPDDAVSAAAPLAALGGREVLLQRFLPAILSEGEHSLVFLNGAFSHAVRKVAAAGEFRVQEERGATILSETPSADLIETAAAVLARLDAPPLYARVDLVRDEGWPTLMELELIEPSLYLRTDPGAPARFAAAIDAWARA